MISGPNELTDQMGYRQSYKAMGPANAVMLPAKTLVERTINKVLCFTETPRLAA